VTTGPIIIDTDPGQDDAVAILLALASPELGVLGITTVSGNVPLPLTSRNARIVCELAGRPDVAVHAGAERPLVRRPVTAEYVHGHSGLDGFDLPEPLMALHAEPAAEFLVRAVMGAPPGTITLCALGPLTNVALALQAEPALAERLAGVVLMGGGFFEGGNTTPVAEFNIYVDPEAAEVVFTSGVSLTMLPLDVTHQALIKPQHLARLRALGNRVGAAVAGWLEFYERYDVEKYGLEGGPLHDPCVIAYLLRPEIFSGRRCNVRIETRSELTMGMTVVDWWGVTGLEPNCTVIRRLDAEAFFDLLIERMGRLR
jgi:purine nucleosidase